MLQKEIILFLERLYLQCLLKSPLTKQKKLELLIFIHNIELLACTVIHRHTHFHWNEKFKQNSGKIRHTKSNTSAGVVHLVVFEVPTFALAERDPIKVGAFRSFLVAFGVFQLAQAANCREEAANVSTVLSEPTIIHVCFPQASHSAHVLL